MLFRHPLAVGQRAGGMKAVGMNTVLSEIIKTGKTETATGGDSVDIYPHSISTSEGQFLQKLVRELDPTISLEVGLAYGVSALFICDALTVRNGTRHITIDPNEHGGPWGDSWEGIGIANLRRAGYGDIVRLIEAPSYRALPELESSGQRIDFAFIDGWHTFDFCLIDFFLIDRMLNVGGVVALDDTNFPAIRKVCRFVKTNLSYSVLGVAEPDPTLLKRPLLEGLLISTLTRKFLRNMGLASRCVAFRKEGNDRRRWDHFVDF